MPPFEIDSTSAIKEDTYAVNDRTELTPDGTNNHDPRRRLPHSSTEVSGSDPIAIVGMACRLPGGINSDQDLWEFLCDGRSAQGKVPGSRFNIDAFYNPQDLPDMLPNSGGYFIDEDIRLFENSFFGINNLEATCMDPQQRKLLEVCYECLESAGVQKYAGTNVGCYVANFAHDFQAMITKDSGYQPRLAALGGGPAMLANRISYQLDLRGPSMTLDTACSSSLYALHVAIKALRQGECDGALVGGVNLIQSQDMSFTIARIGALSKTSTCHTFDASADGYGRADGVGALFIKRLSDAIRDGDPIRSVIRGTAVNSNGKTSAGITAPSIAGQCEVIAKAYADAGIDPALTDYVECHGTGTQLGDPIEVAAVMRSMRDGEPAKPINIGSVKTNLGHSEAASGITSIMKATLALERQWIPPTIGISEMNPKIAWDTGLAHVVTSGMSWPVQASHNGIQRASVNSFGYGGSNAHCILERYVTTDQPLPSTNHGVEYPTLLPISAASFSSLHQRAEDLSKTERPLPVNDLAHTLINRRPKHACRGFLIAERDEWQAETISDQFRQSCNRVSEAALPLAYIFTGQGAQWPGMGRHLFERFSVFRDTILRLDTVVKNLEDAPDWSLRGLILDPKDSTSIHQPACSQTACTALQIALVDLLESWGVHPKYVVGHSSGEIAAAYAARHISASKAIIIAYGRGCLVSQISVADAGAMIAVGIDEKEAHQRIQDLNLVGSVQVACINSPENVTISGDEAAIDQMFLELTTAQVFVRRVKTGGKAYHSHHMKAVGPLYQQYLKSCAHNYPEVEAAHPVQMVSTVHCGLVDKGDTATAAYWRSNLESPVRFKQALETLQGMETCQMIELGPHSLLELVVKQTLAQEHVGHSGRNLYLPSVIRNHKGHVCLLNLAGKLWCRDYAIDLNQVNAPAQRTTETKTLRRHVLHDLPKYPWNYGGLLWDEPRRSKEYRFRQFAHDELLGSLVPGLSGATHTWRNKFMLKDAPWIGDHIFGEEVIFPAAGYIDMALKAFQQVQVICGNDIQGDLLEVRNMRLLKALPLAQNGSIELFTELQREALSSIEHYSSIWSFTISTWIDGQVTKRAVGTIAAIPLTRAASLRSGGEAPEFTEVEQKADNWYRRFAEAGLHFGPSFQTIGAIWTPRMRNAYACRARLTKLTVPLDPFQGQYTYRIHPTVIDTQLQLGLITCTRGIIEDVRAWIPTVIHHMRFFPNLSHEDLPKYSTHTFSKYGSVGLSINGTKLRDEHGNILIETFWDATWYAGVQLQRDVERFPMLRLDWVPDLTSVSPSQGGALAAILAEGSSHDADPQTSRSEFLRLIGFASTLRCDARALIFSSVEAADAIWNVLGGGESHQRFGQLFLAQADDSDKLEYCAIDETILPTTNELQFKALSSDDKFDFVIIDDENIHRLGRHLLDRLADNGMLFHLGELPAAKAADSSLELITTGTCQNVHILRPKVIKSVKPGMSKDRKVVLITHANDDPFDHFLSDFLSRSCAVKASIQCLERVDFDSISQDTLVIMTAELRYSILTTATAEQLKTIQTIFSHVSRVLWVVGGNLFSGLEPDMAAALGLSRAVMLEQPALTIQVLGLECFDGKDYMASAAACVEQVLHMEFGYGCDHEFLQHRGLLHVSRCIPDESLNNGFNFKKNAGTVQQKLRDTGPIEMSIGMPGQFDTLRFKQVSSPQMRANGTVEVQVMAIGINAKDVYALSGKVKTIEETFALEYAGVVRKVMPGSGLAVGDRVAIGLPGPFASVVTVPETACVRMLPNETFPQMATFVVPYITAILGLEDFARLQKDESVLIHSAAGGVGTAAIHVAKRIGATIYATVGTQEKRDMLIQKFGLHPDHIFSSRSTLFLDDIMKVTSGKGVDVVLNSLTGDKLRASVEACAAFGRFIEIGKKDMAEGGCLNLHEFSRGLTFASFDLENYWYSRKPSTIRYNCSLLQRSAELYRSHPKPDLQIFGVDQLTQAYRAFANSNRIGRVCVSFEEQDTPVWVQPKRQAFSFSPSKAYLLVGCLGGLGRSLSRYMLENGARCFVFVGRSGTDKPDARMLVEDLKRHGAEVVVAKGDVCDMNVVLKALRVLPLPLGGVVQAAMGLGESLFESMTHDKWSSSLGPKVQGTWNIHRAIEGQHESQLDFFLLTSSLAGSMGTATESNYCAANSFLDYFARYRRRQGKRAAAIGFGTVGEIGYLHEHPEISEMLERRGLTAITEADFIDICDAVLCSDARDWAHSYEPGRAHVVSGLEGTRKLSIWSQGFHGAGLPELADPRLSILVHSGKKHAGADGVESNLAKGKADDLPPALLAAMSTGQRDAATQAVLQVLTTKLSQLVLMPVDQITEDMTLSSIGMDSMLAAEYRSFIFHALRTDVPFLTLTDADIKMRHLAKLIVDNLLT